MNRMHAFRSSWFGSFGSFGALTGLGLALCTTALLGLGLTVSATAEQAPIGSIEFVGKNLFATAKGRFHEWRVTSSSIDLGAPEKSFAVIEVTLASVDTDNQRRDDHLRTADFFEIETYPTARVRAHSLVVASPAGEGGARFTAQFEIDLHGVKKTLPGELELVDTAPRVFEGTLMIDRLEFGIGPKASRWNPMSIDPLIPVRFRVEL